MTEHVSVTHIDTQVRLARAAAENLRPADLASELEHGDLVLIDVREPDELGDGVIEGSVSVPRGVIEFAANPAELAHRAVLVPSRRVVVYSNTGSRSALVVHALYALDYRDVAHLAGGLACWIADGRPVVTQSVIA